jgi:hypothetical protein
VDQRRPDDPEPARDDHAVLNVARVKRLEHAEPSVARAAIARLFAEWPPVLVMAKAAGAAPAWHLLQSPEQFRELLGTLAPQAELHVSSAWDLVNVKGAVVVTRGALGPETE